MNKNIKAEFDKALKELATIALKETQKDNPEMFKETFTTATHEKINAVIKDISETGKEFGYKITIKYIVNVE